MFKRYLITFLLLVPLGAIPCVSAQGLIWNLITPTYAEIHLEVLIYGDESGWKISYKYPSDRIKPVDTGELVLPTDKNIRFSFTSGDLIRVCRTEDRTISMDGIPGRLNEQLITFDVPVVHNLTCHIDGSEIKHNVVVFKVIPLEEYGDWDTGT